MQVNYAYYFIDDVSVMLKETSNSSEITISKWSVYPIPSSDFLNFDGLSSKESVEYKISNQFGVVVTSGTIFQNKIDISSLDQGLFFLSLEGSTLKFIKSSGL